MQEPNCKVVSDLYYEGRLIPQNKGISDFFIQKEKFYSFDTPIVLQNIDDEGLQFSDKEAERIEEIAYKYEQYGISSQHIGILAPFKAQVANIKRKIKASGRISAENKNNITIDTVDKMQGQEREIIIFSMTGGASDYILEMSDFLYHSNKLNVAFSRAKFILIILGNFNKIKQLQLSDYPHLQKMFSLSYVESLNNL